MIPKDVILNYCMAFDEQLFNRHAAFESPKCGTLQCHNSLIYFLCRRLESDHSVLSFGQETPQFEHYDPLTDSLGQSKFDLCAQTTAGKRLFIVASLASLQTPEQVARIEAAECAALDLKAEFEICTEFELFGPNPEYMQSVILHIMGSAQ